MALITRGAHTIVLLWEIVLLGVCLVLMRIEIKIEDLEKIDEWNLVYAYLQLSLATG